MKSVDFAIINGNIVDIAVPYAAFVGGLILLIAAINPIMTAICGGIDQWKSRQ